MSEENKALVRRAFEELWNTGNVAVADEFIATDYVAQIPAGTPPLDWEGHKQMYLMFRTAYPDLHFTLEDMVAEGDKVVVRYTARGTHKAELMGIAPTGKQVTVGAILIVRFAGGKIVEHWEVFDALGMMQQIGAVPTPEEGGG